MANVIFQGPTQKRQNPFSTLAQGVGTGIGGALTKNLTGRDRLAALMALSQGGGGPFSAALGARDEALSAEGSGRAEGGPTVQAGQAMQTNPNARALKILQALQKNPAALADDTIFKSILEGKEGYNLPPGGKRYDANNQLVASNEKPADAPTFSRVIGGDDALNERFGLGIPKGENARVEMVRDPETGRIVNASVKGRFGSGTTVNVGSGETAFAKELGKQQGQAIANIVEAGEKATGTEATLRQMGDLLAQGVQTGSLAPAVSSLQGIAEDLGVDLNAVAKRFKIDIGNLSEKQNFDRLATQVIIDGFEKFKGNLNSKEVQLAQDAFANLGKSEQANIDAIAAGLASQEIARERATRAATVTSGREAAMLRREFIAAGTTSFETLKEKYKTELQSSFAAAREANPTLQETGVAPALGAQAREAAQGLPAGIPEGSKLVGKTADGLPVYQTPDGQQVVVE